MRSTQSFNWGDGTLHCPPPHHRLAHPNEKGGQGKKPPHRRNQTQNKTPQTTLSWTATGPIFIYCHIAKKKTKMPNAHGHFTYNNNYTPVNTVNVKQGTECPLRPAQLRTMLTMPREVPDHPHILLIGTTVIVSAASLPTSIVAGISADTFQRYPRWYREASTVTNSTTTSTSLRMSKQRPQPHQFEQHTELLDVGKPHAPQTEPHIQGHMILNTTTTKFSPTTTQK